MTDRHGAVPLPPGRVHIKYTVPQVPDAFQQPQAQQVAVFDAERNDECPNGSVLDFNNNFVVYAVKNGLIRVLHRKSSRKHLLRTHEGKQVTDIKFFHRGDVLGTIGGNLVISRVFERAQEIVVETLLEFPETMPSMSRMMWHPFNPNQFWLIHRDRDGVNVATLVETTSLLTTMHPIGKHPVCKFHDTDIVYEGEVQLSTDSDLTDLDWCHTFPRRAMTAHVDGTIKLWDFREPSPLSSRGVNTAVCKITIQESLPVSRCFFLPHDDVATIGSPRSTSSRAFCTATDGNSCITIWSPLTESEAPSKLQVFQLEDSNPNFNICLCNSPYFIENPADPGAVFVLLSDRTAGNLYALSLKSISGTNEENEPQTILLEGFDYLVPFSTKYPTYSWCVGVVPADDFDEDADVNIDFDIRFYALQSKMVQEMCVPHYMLVPPTNLWEADTPELHVELLPNLDRNGIDSDVYEDDYDIDVEDDEEEYDAPDPSSLPPPDCVGTPGGGDNAFANWLGNLAAKAPAVGVPEPMKPVTVASMSPASLPPGLFAAPVGMVAESRSSEGSGLLSPMAILSSGASDTPIGKNDDTQATQKKPKPQGASSPKTKGKDKKVQAFPSGPLPSSDGKIAILKRDREVPLPVEALADTAMSSPTSIEESLKKSIAIQFRSQEKIIAAEIQRVVRQEIKLMVLPELGKVVTTAVQQSVIRPLQSSMEKAIKGADDTNSSIIIQGVASGIEEPLKEAFTESMKVMLIPAFEAATKEMFSQVRATFETQATPQKSTDDDLNAKIDALTAMVQLLTEEVTKLKRTESSVLQPPQADEQQEPVDPIQLVRSEILDLLKNQKFDAAFTMAVSATTAEIAVFVCKNANLTEVLGGSSPILSQPILLCLMQQLGAALSNSVDDDLNTELMWLQEIALTLDSSDPSISKHVPPVLTQLVTSIEVKMQQGVPNLRRPLQMLLQVIRGMQR